MTILRFANPHEGYRQVIPRLNHITWSYSEASEQWPVQCSCCGTAVTDIYWAPFVDENTDPRELDDLLDGSSIGEFCACDSCYREVYLPQIIR